MNNPADTVTRLAFWRDREGYSNKTLGDALGVSEQQAFRYCLPPDHKDFRRPRRDPGRLLLKLSNGEVHSDNASDPVDPETGDPVTETALSPIHRASGDPCKEVMS